MNEQQRRLIDKPSIESEFCAFCYKPRTERHHIVKRSQGGTAGPTVAVCGHGNVSGCHALLEQQKLHLDWAHGWVYKRTEEPTKDVWLTTSKDGWEPVVVYERLGNSDRFSSLFRLR